MTNAEKIKSLSNDSMAMFLWNIHVLSSQILQPIAAPPYLPFSTKDEVLEWLNQEAEDDKWRLD